MRRAVISTERHFSDSKSRNHKKMELQQWCCGPVDGVTKKVLNQSMLSLQLYFGTFDFQEHGKSHYGFPYNAPRNRRSSQGKMEKSLLRYVLLDELS
ncbi:hypothetical protein VIGAN_09123100 [Vigna angularis var. angularis]|uniref:Uncharacterized protein n=1 Tax=Vigna angularis var. angularis TaxID=157739 RepID=A0A0S3SYF5_PHAAN|nr:hypothetical protein VIGAN_09123100 [Vigna angularis var. angularis]